MSPQAASNKVRNDKQKAAVRLQPAFPAAVEEDSDLIDELPHLECARTSLPDPISQEHGRTFEAVVRRDVEVAYGVDARHGRNR